MSNSETTRYISTVKIKLRCNMPECLSCNDTSKVIKTPVRNIAHQNEVIRHNTQDYLELNQKLVDDRYEKSLSDYILPITNTDKASTDFPRSSIFAHSYDEKAIEDLIECMKNEEQYMEQKLGSMEHGEERMIYEIELMKHYENRIEREIELMKHHEESTEDIVSVQTSLFDNDQKFIENKNEQIKKREKHINYEIERMEHYQIRFKNEIRYIRNEIDCTKYFSTPEHHDEIHQEKIQLNKRAQKLEKLGNELAKRQTKLVDHSNEIKKRQTKLEEYRDKRMKYEHKLAILRNMIIQEEERIERQKQLRREAIERRQIYEFTLRECREERIVRQIKLLKQSDEPQQFQTHLVKNDEKCTERDRQYRKRALELREKLSINRANLYTFMQQQEVEWPRIWVPWSDFQLMPPPCGRAQSLGSTYSPIRQDAVFVNPDLNIDFESFMIIDQPKYDIVISCANQNDSIIGCIQNALPQCFSTYVRDNFSSRDIKVCLDNISTAVIAVINKTYELGQTSQSDMTNIFKRQFPLVLVISEDGFQPSTSCLTIIWHAFNTQKVFFNFTDFETNLRSAITDAQWNLSPNLNILNMTQSTTDERSIRFLGDLHEWTIAYNNPARISQSYRQLINDPLRIETDIKLQNIYYNYIRRYFENSDIMRLFEKGINGNNIHDFIRAYTQTGTFSGILNRHLSANVLFYFESTLYDTVDYQLVNCLIDCVALCIYRQELQLYVFTGIVYRGMVMSEKDLFKYIVGSRIMNTSFLSTSKDKKVAEFFSGQKQQEFAVLCTYIIYNNDNRRTALDIASISCLPHEREILILPFSPFYVKSVTPLSNRSGPIEIVLVEDQMDISENADTMIFTDY